MMKLQLLLILMILTIVQSIPEIPVTLSIKENIQSQHVIANLTDYDDDKDLYDRNVVYKLGSDSDLFQIDNSENGSQLTTKRTVDAEEICGDNAGNDNDNTQQVTTISCGEKENVVITFNVNVFDGSDRLVKIMKITLTIIDVDDERPNFERKTHEINTREILTKAGDKLDLIPAIDRDINQENRYLCYLLRDPVKLETGSKFFSLSVEDGMPKLVVLKQLDSEVIDKVHLELLAISCTSEEENETVCKESTDTSTRPPAILPITINIVDMNDNRPEFSDDVDDSVEIREDTIPPKEIYQMRATDRDKTSQLTYTLVDKRRALRKIFEVKPDGRVILIGPLDYELHREYNLEIMVSDGEHKARKSLRVRVLDVNDEAPTFELNPAILSVPENDHPGKVIGQVTIVDRDTPTINGKVTCYEPDHLRGRQPLEFNPDPNKSPSIGKYSLSTRLAFDRESLPNTVLSTLLICRDGSEQDSSGQKRFTSTLTIGLTITDENDWPPEFPFKSPHLVRVSENNLVGDIVAQLSARDKDMGENAKLTYTISDTENFRVNASTGLITANRRFDREERDIYNFLLTVKDNGQSPQLSASLTVDVHITDVNDNSPVLLPCPTLSSHQQQNTQSPIHYMGEYRRSNAFRVKENVPVNTLVGHVLAVDIDAGVNSVLTYEFVNGETNSGSQFRLLPNGTLLTGTILNREDRSAYNLLVGVRDAGVHETSRTTTGIICIDIDDENDNAPIFKPNDYLIPLDEIQYNLQNDEGSHPDSMRKFGSRHLSLSIHEKSGHHLIRVEASDRDHLDNSIVHYMMNDLSSFSMRGNTNFLSINPDTGVISTTRNLKERDFGQYSFNITAADGGIPSKASSIGLIVKVENVEARGHMHGEAVSKYYADVPEISWWNDSRNLLIVIILGTVSAVLAMVLVTAVICMLRPCLKRYNSTCQLNSGNEPLIQGYHGGNLQTNRRSTTWLHNQDEVRPSHQTYLGLVNMQNQRILNPDVENINNYGNIISMPKFEPILDTTTDDQAF